MGPPRWFSKYPLSFFLSRLLYSQASQLQKPPALKNIARAVVGGGEVQGTAGRGATAKNVPARRDLLARRGNKFILAERPTMNILAARITMLALVPTAEGAPTWGKNAVTWPFIAPSGLSFSS